MKNYHGLNCLIRPFRTKPVKDIVKLSNEQGNAFNLASRQGKSFRSFRTLLKPTGFLISVAGISVAGCSIWQYENMKDYSKKVYGNIYIQKYGILRQKIYNIWNHEFSKAQQLTVLLICLNAVVFVFWQFPPFHPFLLQYFTSHPLLKSPCWSMLFSIFSHCNLWHLSFNMIALWSFAPAAISILGREQFLAFYLTSGTFASLTSYMYKLAMASTSVSLGASGALMAIVALVCSQYPDTKLAIIFLPWFTFSGLTALRAMFVFDSLGVLFRWKLFDHAAHLGGLLFGLWYMKYGDEYIWSKREYILSKWHNLRKYKS